MPVLYHVENLFLLKKTSILKLFVLIFFLFHSKKNERLDLYQKKRFLGEYICV